MKHELSTLIIGAGPAGLSAAYELANNSIPTRIVDADPDYVGGLARTVQFKGYRFDLGGHRFYSKSQEVRQFWNLLLGDEMRWQSRTSRIFFGGKFFHYPIRPLDAMRRLGLPYALLTCLSFLKAKIFPRRQVDSFEDWIVNNFGYRLYATFFKTYTEKVWGMPCDEISADWAAQRIRGLSLGSLIRHALRFGARGALNRPIAKTLIDHFQYPRLGPGQLWEAAAAQVREQGGEISMGCRIRAVRRDAAGRLEVEGIDSKGVTARFGCNQVISSMPLGELLLALRPSAPTDIVKAARSLKHRDFLVVAVILDKPDLFPDNWIYVHDQRVRVARIQNVGNWSAEMIPDPSTSCVLMEYFCTQMDALWSRSDSELAELAQSELGTLRLTGDAKVIDTTVIRVPQAYPVYDAEYSETVHSIRHYLDRCWPEIQAVGRNGMHRYNNQDHAIMTGFLAARNIISKSRSLDPWRVNQDAAYLEEATEEESLLGGRLAPAAESA